MELNQQLYNFVYDNVMQLLRDKRITVDDIDDEVEYQLKHGLRYYKGASVDKEKITRHIIYDFGIIEDSTTVLEDNRDHIEWLANERANIEWNFWKRYKKYLEKVERLPGTVVDEIDDTTDEILKRLESPKREGAWDRRGMVVGNVQSGKTSNYTGLIAKAVDAQYKVIIVLAGLNNDLRSQTQKRIDKGFLGRDTRKKDNYDQTDSRIGVGLIPGFPDLPVIALTSADASGDFKKNVHSSVTVTPGGDPIIVVVKKNVTPLKNLLNWFEGQNKSGKIQNVPLLLIDDEADNASIDTKAAKRIGGAEVSEDAENDPTKINGYIRQILNSFAQSAYIGYTATPFANIFIYPIDEENKDEKFGDDLFPRSFIVNLHAPSNYIGPEKVFGLEKDKIAGIENSVKPLPLTRVVDDYELFFPEKHKSNWTVPGLPSSLVKAMYAFILSAAARDLRGQSNKHKSMLVHVTRFVNVQEQITDLLKAEMRKTVMALEFKTGPHYKELISEMKNIWENDFVPTTKSVMETFDDPGITEIPWESIEKQLYFSASKIEVRTINGKAADGGLEYDLYPNGLNVIAVGGDKLSRGLTLEGLSVSYYARLSKMYDTLLQMGRWFGYRPGYADLCRLYTSKQLREWYRHIAIANEELRRDFDDMVAMNLTPSDYGLKVRTHPDGMIITALNKMRNSMEREVTFSGKLIQVTRYLKKDASNERNLMFLNNWVSQLGNPQKPCVETHQNYLWKEINSDKILQFIEGIKINQAFENTSLNMVKEYIAKQNLFGELKNWTVGLVSTTYGLKTESGSIEVGPCKIGMSWRTDNSFGEDSEVISLISNNLITEDDQTIDMSVEEMKVAKQKTIENWKPSKKSPNKPDKASPVWVRAVRPADRGLLLIYVFKSGVSKEDVKVTYDDIYIGYAISFPGSPTAQPVKYRVDDVYVRNENDDE